MRKNYYVILGISASASLEEVKAAFRRRALDLHPDHSGRDSEPFLELREAYLVLSEPERRRQYDLESEPPLIRRRPRGPAPEPLSTRRPKAEPFRPVATVRLFQEVSRAESFRPHPADLDRPFFRFWII